MALEWAEVHKTMWVHRMRGVEPNARASYAEAWERASGEIIDAWENSVKLALQAQLDWTGLWMLRLRDEKGSPKEVVEWADQSYELLKAWTDAQLEMWNVWFASLRRFGPLEHADGFVETYKIWHNAVCESLDASAEWMRTWSEHRQRVDASGNGADGASERPLEKAAPA